MQKKNLFSIAIDGPAGAGKSTVAKALAKALDAMYLDTGAMYRAFGLAMLRAGVDLDDAEAVKAGLDAADIGVEYLDGAQHIFLGGEDVSEAIRQPEVSAAASAISAVPEVREHMVALQRRIAEGHCVVMDGRDIGTVVLPNATLKIYLTASAEVRAARRDMHREASPLRAAEDARTVDTSDMTRDEVIEALRRMAVETCKLA